MPQMKMSYTDIRYTFTETDYGVLHLELAVGREKVIGKDKQGIKLSILRSEVRESSLPMIAACREAEPDRFNEFCDKLENLDNEEA